MKVIYVSKNSKLISKPCILCLGNFDGLHLGHQYIIKKVIKEAKSFNCPAAVLTFRPHPANVLKASLAIKMLMRFDERLELLDRLGVQICYVINFDRQFSKLSARDFIKDILVSKINPKKVIVGGNFHFGKNCTGDVRLLKKLSSDYQFDLEVIRPRKVLNMRVSSSLIRKLLESSRIGKANRFLARPYSIQGDLIAGRRLGRRIGFPTLNINYNSKIVLPLGIFSGFIHIAERFYRAVIYIGFQPSLGQRHNKPVLEVHVLDFKKNIHSKKLEVFLIKKIRSEKKFKSLEDLKKAIKKDLKKVNISRRAISSLIKKTKGKRAKISS